MFENAKWIIHQDNKQYEAVSFKKELNLSKKVKKATLYITSLGVYCAEIDGVRVGDFILAPGFTSRKRKKEYGRFVSTPFHTSCRARYSMLHLFDLLSGGNISEMFCYRKT
jgi:hypothetical protein